MRSERCGVFVALMLAVAAVVPAATRAAAPAIYNLGTLGGSASQGYAINASGQVTGVSYPTGSTVWHAFLYTGAPGADGHMIDLDAWLDANNPAEGTKWTLSEADGLTDTGLVTGRAIYDDGPGGQADGWRAFLLDASALVVPEPASIVLLGIGAALTVGIGCYRASRSRR